MWTDIEGQNVKIALEVVPNSVWRYMSLSLIHISKIWTILGFG